MISSGVIRKVLLGAAMVAAPIALHAQFSISVGFAPPVLPVYAQPVCPQEGYLWTPGYWAYAEGGYYWVPGVWVQPPTVGYLWTPPYWGFAGGGYGFHPGYWGPHVGFYGGVNYGFGYGGIGFGGGRWDGGHFAYNTAVNNVNVTNIHNTYVDRTVIVNNTVINNNHTSYNGGPNGINAQPRQEDRQAEHERHENATSQQQLHYQNAQGDKGNFAANNGGHPRMAAQTRIGTTQGAVASRGAMTTNRDGFGHGNEVNTRQGNQQSRVGNGVKDGQMTPGEARNVQNRDTSIANQTARDRAANGGTLTGQERQQIHQRQNNVSNSINRDNHNANNDAAAAARNGRTTQQEQNRAQQVERNHAPTPGPAGRPQGLPHEAPGSGGYRPQPAPRPQPQQAAPRPQAQPRPQPQRAEPAPRQEAPHSGGERPRR